MNKVYQMLRGSNRKEKSICTECVCIQENNVTSEEVCPFVKKITRVQMKDSRILMLAMVPDKPLLSFFPNNPLNKNPDKGKNKIRNDSNDAIVNVLIC
jgi:hypothetical protein